MSSPDRGVRSVGIVGAGLMGVGIAEVALAAGVDVRAFDPSSNARSTFGSRLDAAFESHDVAPAAGASWAVFSTVGDAVAEADLVIECGPEDPDVKAMLFTDIDRLVRPDVCIASNTSSIPLSVLGAAVTHRSRLLGMHFWNPPALVPLVEVVSPPTSDAELASRIMDELRAWQLVPVLVSVDVPGIVGNRLQHALKREAIALVANGVCSAETVDLVVKHGFGSRLGVVGPLEQSDLSGLELTLSIHRVLMPHLDNTPVAHPYLEDLVDRGDVGAHVGRGFRDWAPGEADRRRREIADELLNLARRRKKAQDGQAP